MGVLRDAIAANGRRRAGKPDPGAAFGAASEVAVEPARSVGETPPAGAMAPARVASGAGRAPKPPPARVRSPSALERRREELAREVAELHWDLGGLAYEMAIRDHFRLDVLVRRAAMLQERDAELAEIESLVMQELPAARREPPAGGDPPRP